MPIKLKTMKYLDVLEVLDEVEKSSKRPGLKDRVWTQCCGDASNGAMTYINIEDSHEELIESYGKEVGNDLEAIKQAVSHISPEDICWFATW